ncbi:MAG: hypothetical protein ABIW79_03110, partial [Gemmatimonas sp.]
MPTSLRRATFLTRCIRGGARNPLARAGRQATQALLLVLVAACTDKAFVSSLGGHDREALLGVSIALGGLQTDDISAVRIVARYTGPTGAVVLRDVTVPYAQGESRSVPLTLDIAACLRDANSGTVESPSCPVQTTVDVLAGTRVLARDELPIVQVSPGETVTAPALAA